MSPSRYARFSSSPRLSSPTPYRSPSSTLSARLVAAKEFFASSTLKAGFVPLKLEALKRLHSSSPSSDHSEGSTQRRFENAISISSKSDASSRSRSHSSSPRVLGFLDYNSLSESSEESQSEDSGVSDSEVSSYLLVGTPRSVSSAAKAQATRAPASELAARQLLRLKGQPERDAVDYEAYLWEERRPVYIVAVINNEQVISRLERATEPEDRAMRRWFVEKRMETVENGSRHFVQIFPGEDLFIPVFHPEHEANWLKLWLLADGWMNDNGVSKAQLAQLCCQCVRCRHYMSQESKTRHKCPEGKIHKTRMGEVDLAGLAKWSDRFNNTEGCGLNAEEFQHFFVRCTACKKYVTRNAAFHHHHSKDAEKVRALRRAARNRRRL